MLHPFISLYIILNDNIEKVWFIFSANILITLFGHLSLTHIYIYCFIKKIKIYLNILYNNKLLLKLYYVNLIYILKIIIIFLDYIVKMDNDGFLDLNSNENKNKKKIIKKINKEK